MSGGVSSRACLLTSCDGLVLVQPVRKSDHGAAISVLCVAPRVCRSAQKTPILGVRAPMAPAKPDTEISFSAPWRTTEQEGRRFSGNAALNSKDLRLFLEQRV